MKKNYQPLWIVMTIFLFSASCRKFTDAGQPKNQLTSAEVFADSTDANSAMLGLYVNMMQSFALNITSGGMTLYPGLSADELAQTAANATVNEFYVNNISPANTANANLWTSAYKDIYMANAIIAGVSSPDMSAAARNRITAETKFLRSFIYFNLVNLYGAVPLVTTPDYSISSVVSRTSPEIIYTQLITDLQFAESNLPAVASPNDRATSYAASALLAKIYLYEGKYDLAQAEASKVISSGAFSLVADLNGVFLAGSSETIFKLDPVIPGKPTWEGYTFVPSSASVLPKYALNATLYNAFEAGDLRKAKWIRLNTVRGKQYPYPYKYKQYTSPGTPGEDYVVFRLAEMYLVRAEAEANQNNVSSGIQDVNIIRNRAGLANTSAADKNSLLAAIRQEKRVEYFCEWGNRWLDLKRWNLANQVLSTQKPNWTTNAQLYPVPASEITRNPNLVQNPGY